MSSTDTGRGGVDRRSLLKGGAGRGSSLASTLGDPGQGGRRQGHHRRFRRRRPHALQGKDHSRWPSAGLRRPVPRGRIRRHAREMVRRRQERAPASTTSICSTIRGCRSSARPRCSKTSAPAASTPPTTTGSSLDDRHGLLAAAPRARGSKASRTRRRSLSACPSSATCRP